MSEMIRDRVIAILAEQALLEPGEISLEATPESLGIDSMALVETVFGIEEAFDIQVPFNANTPGDSGFDITSVGSIIAAVEALVAAKDSV